MKINFQKLMRVLPSLLTVFVVVLFCVCPVFAVAEPVSIWDYADIEVDGTTKHVTVRFPDEWVEITVPRYNGQIFFQEQGNGSMVNFTDSGFTDVADVFLSPFGAYFKTDAERPYSGYYLDLSVLPVGSELSFAVSARINAPDITRCYATKSWFIYGSYLPQTGTITDFVTTDVEFTQPESSLFSFKYSYIVNGLTDCIVPEAKIRFVGLPAVTGRIEFNLSEFVITTTVDALQDLQETVKQNNALLDEIKEQMNINNQNWQDFLDGKAEWQDIVDTSTDKVEDAVGDMNDIGDALATIPKPEIDIETLVPDELAGQQYLNYTAALSRLWENPIISTVAYIMGCLLIFSYLLFGERG